VPKHLPWEAMALQEKGLKGTLADVGIFECVAFAGFYQRSLSVFHPPHLSTKKIPV